MTFADKAAGYRNPAVAMAKLHARAKEVKTYEEHDILAGYMEATMMRFFWGVAYLTPQLLLPAPSAGFARAGTGEW